MDTENSQVETQTPKPQRRNRARGLPLGAVINWITNEQFANGAGEPKIDGDVYTWEMEVAE